jgi:sugar lactone lactonase YvrE
MTKAEQATDPVAYHGEGPVWSSTWGGLRWVDMLAGDVLQLDPDGGISRTHVGKIAAVVRPRAGGGAIVALEHGFALTDGPLTELRPLAEVIADPGIRLNEGGCDPDGRFYCGSMAYHDGPGAGSFYRLDVDGIVEVVLDSVTVSNGFDFSPDRSLAYYIDTPTHRVDIFDYSPDGGLSGRRPWVHTPDGGGGPDGLTVDSQGYVWVAFYGGGVVRRYAADGRLDDVVELPVRKITACTFGGDDLQRLYISTSREGLEPGEQPEAGSLFTLDTGVAGREPLAYGG